MPERMKRLMAGVLIEGLPVIDSLEDARKYVEAAPTPEARRARKVLVHGQTYGVTTRGFVHLIRKKGE